MSFLVFQPVFLITFAHQNHEEFWSNVFSRPDVIGAPLKVLERVLEKRIKCQVSIDNMQFGFMLVKGNH